MVNTVYTNAVRQIVEQTKLNAAYLEETRLDEKPFLNSQLHTLICEARDYLQQKPDRLNLTAVDVLREDLISYSRKHPLSCAAPLYQTQLAAHYTLAHEVQFVLQEAEAILQAQREFNPSTIVDLINHLHQYEERRYTDNSVLQELQYLWGSLQRATLHTQGVKPIPHPELEDVVAILRPYESRSGEIQALQGLLEAELKQTRVNGQLIA